MNASSARDARLAALRVEIGAIERSGFSGADRPCLPFGIAEVDSRLAGGGLAPGLHESAAAAPSLNDEAAATLFLAALAARFSRRGEEKGQVLWALTRRDLFAPGLAQGGLGPDRLIYAECRNDDEVLAVMEEAVRHGSLSAVLGEASRVAMPATRRLHLAAEEGGTAALLLRRAKKAEADPLAMPSAALTRWRIGCAPSVPLPVEGVGRACLVAELARQRGGDPCSWILEAPDAEARLALFSHARDRPHQTEERRAA